MRGTLRFQKPLPALENCHCQELIALLLSMRGASQQVMLDAFFGTLSGDGLRLVAADAFGANAGDSSVSHRQAPGKRRSALVCAVFTWGSSQERENKAR